MAVGLLSTFRNEVETGISQEKYEKIKNMAVARGWDIADLVRLNIDLGYYRWGDDGRLIAVIEGTPNLF